MHEATITAQYVNGPYRDPATGVIKSPDWGSIKTPDGTRYSVPVGMVSLFRAGQSYLVGYTTNDKGYHTIKEVKPSAGAVLSGVPSHTAPNSGAEKGMLTKIAIELKARGLSDDEAFATMRAGLRVTDRVMAVNEMEETVPFP